MGSGYLCSRALRLIALASPFLPSLSASVPWTAPISSVMLLLLFPGEADQSVLGENTNVNNENQNANALPALAVKVVPDATGNEENVRENAVQMGLSNIDRKAPPTPSSAKPTPRNPPEKQVAGNNGGKNSKRKSKGVVEKIG